MDDRAPFSNKLNILSHLCFLLALAVRPSPYRYFLFFPVCGINIYLVFFTTTGNIVSDITYIILPYIFVASDYILLTNVQRELYIQGQKKPASDLPFRSRLVWAFKLWSSPRCIGWSHEQTYVLPPRPTASRRTFMLTQSLWACVYILLHDISRICNKWNPCFSKDGPPFSHYGWSWQLLSVIQLPLAIVPGMSLVYSIFSIASVAIGMSEPREWPHLFGKWSDAYTVRRFWSRTWHQIWRRMLTSHGKLVAHKVFRLKQGTNASAFVQLYTAFFISALFHTGVDYMVLYNWSWGSIVFFMAQAVAITFESAMIALAKMAGIGGLNIWRRLLGYMWVWCCFAYFAPAWVEPQFRSGLDENLPHFSVIFGLWRGEWFPKT